MTDPVDQLALKVICVLNQKMEKVGTRNNSYPFSYDLTRETIRAVAAQVVAYYQPKGFICRLDLSPNSVGPSVPMMMRHRPPGSLDLTA
jgi:hypothetical protein